MNQQPTNQTPPPNPTPHQPDPTDQPPDLLRLTTAGSVDDGKSTLIGRLLYDTKTIHQDQLQAIQQTSRQLGHETTNLALLTDGLRAERQQGITIDVAYRYFATPRRKFIIADTPGHTQYTRNMITGASTAHLAIILIDARKGITEQTRRHTFITSLLNIQHLILAINKMDLIQYNQTTYQNIIQQFKNFSSRLQIPHIDFIPISALHGHNITQKTDHMPWYQGSPLLYTLETIYIGNQHNHIHARFPIQYVIRPQSPKHPDHRAYAGRIASGVFKTGDHVTTLPSGYETHITHIHTPNGDQTQAHAPMSIALQLQDPIDISRGDMIVKPNHPPTITQNIETTLCWLSHQQPLKTNHKYTLLTNTRETKCLIKQTKYKININTLHKIPNPPPIRHNDIARVTIHTADPIFTDPYTHNRATGSLILIDEHTHQTIAAGMIT